MASLAQISNAGATPASLSGSRCATVAVVRLRPNPSSQATRHNLVWTSIKPPGMALQLLLAGQCFANSVVDKYTRTQDYSEFNSLSRIASRNVITHSRQCRRKKICPHRAYLVLVAVINRKGTLQCVGRTETTHSCIGRDFDAHAVHHRLDQLSLKTQCLTMS
jgi:hypothetical protein